MPLFGAGKPTSLARPKFATTVIAASSSTPLSSLRRRQYGNHGALRGAFMAALRQLAVYPSTACAWRWRMRWYGGTSTAMLAVKYAERYRRRRHSDGVLHWRDMASTLNHRLARRRPREATCTYLWNRRANISAGKQNNDVSRRLNRMAVDNVMPACAAPTARIGR